MDNINNQFKAFEKEFKGVEAIITPEELKAVFSYVEDMENSLNKLTHELEGLKAKMNNIEADTVTKRKEVPIAPKELKETLKLKFEGGKEAFAKELQESVTDLKMALLSKATEIKQCVHEKNLEGLNAIMESLDIKKLCEKIKILIESGIEKTKDLQDKINFVGIELGQAKGHLNNIKEMHSNDMKFKSIEFNHIKNGLKNTQNVLEKMYDNTDVLNKNLENLSKTVDFNKEKNRELAKEALSQKLRIKNEGTPKLCMG